jgi:monovalent cation/hydrogen antiporter
MTDKKEACEHIIVANTDAEPNTPDGCEECLKMGDSWVHLRLCLTCGHVGCCDDSKNKHAAKHFKSTKHPVIKSLESGENWLWCFVDKISQ